MRTGDLRRILAHRGPFATVHMNTSHVPDRSWRRALFAKGASRHTLTALDDAVRATPPAGNAGWLLVASGGTVLLNRQLTRPPRHPVTRVGPLPYLLPLIETVTRAVPHVAALVGRTSTELSAFDGDTTLRRTVYRDAVAAELTALVSRVRARLLVVAGAREPLADLWEALPEHCREILVEPSSPPDAEVDFDRVVTSLAAQKATADRYARVDRFLAGLTTGDAVQGLADTAAALRAGTAATVVISDPVIGDAALWTSADPRSVALTEAELRASGAAGAEPARADEALPAAAVSTGADLLSATQVRGEPVALTDGVGAQLR